MADTTEQSIDRSAKGALRNSMRKVRRKIASLPDEAAKASEKLADTLLDLLELEIAQRELPGMQSSVGKYDEPTHLPIRKTMGDLWPAHPTNNGSLAAQLSPTLSIAEAEAYAEKLMHSLPAVPPDVRILLGLPTLEEELSGAYPAEEPEPVAPARPARTVAVYSAIGTEISLAPFVQRVIEAPKGTLPEIRFVAPIVLGPQRMEFLEVTAEELLDPVSSGLDFLTDPSQPTLPPLSRRFVPCTDIDLLLVPGLAFGRDGARLGYGAGFYDAYLAMLEQQQSWAGSDMGSWPQPDFGHAARVVGVCYNEQLLEAGEVPVNEEDVRIDCAATPEGVVELA